MPTARDAHEILKMFTEEELGYDSFDDPAYRQYEPPKCECGAKKAGVKYHARWCALYTDPMGKDKKTEPLKDMY